MLLTCAYNTYTYLPGHVSPVSLKLEVLHVAATRGEHARNFDRPNIKLSASGPRNTIRHYYMSLTVAPLPQDYYLYCSHNILDLTNTFLIMIHSVKFQILLLISHILFSLLYDLESCEHFHFAGHIELLLSLITNITRVVINHLGSYVILSLHPYAAASFCCRFGSFKCKSVAVCDRGWCLRDIPEFVTFLFSVFPDGNRVMF